MTDPPSPTGVDGPSSIAVICADEQDEVDLDADRWRILAAAVLDAEAASGELTLTFIGSDEMRELNTDHMGVDAPTDVLSFPLDEGATTSPPLPGDIPLLLGDVVVCPAVAAANAATHAGSLDDELALLVVHGILHVLGHDHDQPEETSLMRSRELELLEALHWRGPAPSTFSQEHADS